MNFRLGELFSGAGGIALGAMHAKIRDKSFSITHEWATDYDKDSCETYIKNICPKIPESVICKDIRKVNLKKLPQIDALAFGFPCNNFSLVGDKKGINGEFGNLYIYGVKALKIFKPLWFFAENVPYLKHVNNGETFKLIIKDLEKAGYTITSHIYKFEEYNVPQARHRIIIIGIRKDLDLEFKVPVLKNAKIITCKEALEKPSISKNAQNHEFIEHTSRVVERLKYIKEGQNACNSDLPEHLKLNYKDKSWGQAYRRLNSKKPAYTIISFPQMYHWKKNRALTNREKARLQTFPDRYFFVGNKESVSKQICMAVPVKSAKIIFEAILKTFAGIKYASIEPNLLITKK
jgi:DNA (cytosine-5)-methyltransferase 1